MNVDEVIGRLTDYTDMMIGRNFTRARILWTFWRSFNALSNPLRDVGLHSDIAAPLLNNLATAARDDAMLIVARMFDGLEGEVFKSDRISFDVMSSLYRRPGVREELLRRAGDRENGRSPAANINDCKGALDTFEGSLSRLRKERPNRIQQFRSFRHRYLAHTLNLPEPTDPPLYGDIEDMIVEAGALLSASQTALRNSVFDWGFIAAETNRQADRIWVLLRDGHVHDLEAVSGQN